MKGKNRIGMLNDISNVISKELNVNIKSVHIDTAGNEFTARFDLHIHDSSQLNTLMTDLKKINGLKKVERIEQE